MKTTIMKSLLRIAVLIVFFIGVTRLSHYFIAPSEYERAGEDEWKDESSKSATLNQPDERIAHKHSTSISNHNQQYSQQSLSEYIEQHCYRPPTEAITQKQKTIHQWRDEHGRIHFGDAPPGQQQHSNISNHQQAQLRSTEYFKLKIHDEYAQLPVFAKERFSSEIRQMYKILKNGLGVKQLRATKISLRLFDHIEDYKQYQNQHAPSLGTSGGFYHAKLNEAVILSHGYQEQAFAVTRHEVSHAIMAGLFGYTPTWINEGLAEYFEQLEVFGQTRRVSANRQHWHLLQQRVRGLSLAEFELQWQTFIRMPPKQWYADQDKAFRYALAWAMVYHLLSHQEGKILVRDMLDHFGKNLCQAFDARMFIDQSYPGGAAQWLNQWLQWMQSDLPVAHQY